MLLLLVTGVGLGLLPPPPGSSGVTPVPPPSQSQHPVRSSDDDWGDFFSSRCDIQIAKDHMVHIIH